MNHSNVRTVLVGDINRDGWPDVAVGARGSEQTLIFFGGPGILDNQPDLVLVGGGAMAFGDLNGDGVCDLVTQRHHQEGTPFPGLPADTTAVYFGQKVGPYAIDTIPGLTILPPQGAGLYGAEINQLLIGDFNDDGFDDLVLTMSGTLVLNSGSSGFMVVYLGRPQPHAVPDIITGPNRLRMRYAEQTCVGDVNGDGVPDLVLASPIHWNGGVIPADTVFVDVFCGNKSWAPQALHPDRRYGDWEFRGPSSSALELATLIDANADGVQDLYIKSADSAFIYFGGSSLFNGNPSRILAKPSSSYDWFGPYAFEIGDITGDGFKDFALHLEAQGMTFLVVYPGDASGITYDRMASDYNQYHYLAPLGACSPVGDINGDGINDFAVGAPSGVNWGGSEGYFVIYSGDSTIHPVAVTAVKPVAEQLWINAPYPNPATGTSTIRSMAPPGTAYCIVVYDLLGRRMRTLDEGVCTSPEILTTWDGRDTAGRFVPSGMYLITLQTSIARTSTILIRLEQ